LSQPALAREMGEGEEDLQQQRIFHS
jgi:hypothetical protein